MLGCPRRLSCAALPGRGLQDIDVSRVSGAVPRHRSNAGGDRQLAAAKKLSYCADVADFRACNFFIVTVPTPVRSGQRRSRAHSLGEPNRGLGPEPGDSVLYKSTVFPAPPRRSRTGAGPHRTSNSIVISSQALRGAHQPRRPDPVGCRRHQGYIRLDAEAADLVNADSMPGHHRRHASRELDSRRRSRQGHRERPAMT